MRKKEKRYEIMRDDKIKAVLDEDMEKLLKSLNVYDSVIAGRHSCIFCNKKITVENIDAIVPRDNSVAFSCNNSVCHLKLIGIEER